MYQTWIEELELITPGVNPDDWAFKYVGRYLFSVLVQITATEARSVVRQVRENNGFEALRLLEERYEPFNYNTEATMITNIHNIAQKPTKSASEMIDVIREVKSAILDFEERCGKKIDQTGMLFVLLNSHNLSKVSLIFLLI